jgi:hypothetical protein
MGLSCSILISQPFSFDPNLFRELCSALFFEQLITASAILRLRLKKRQILQNGSRQSSKEVNAIQIRAGICLHIF